MNRNRIRLLVSDVLLLAKLTHNDVDISDLVLDMTEGMSDPYQKASILSDTAKTLDSAGYHDKAIALLRLALHSARRAGREGVLETLASTTSALMSIDQGRTLWQIYESMCDVDAWWSK